MTVTIGRRELLAALGGAAVAWPLAARAQQTGMPVIGFLNGLGPNDRSNLPAAFRRGLGETGFVDGRNVAIEYRFAENHYDRLPALSADLAGRKMAVIAATGGGASILAAMAATKTVPIVFTSGGDPVQQGYVASLNRPGSNVTGVSWFNNLVADKGLGLLHELVPNAGGSRAVGQSETAGIRADGRRRARSCSQPRAAVASAKCQYPERDRHGVRDNAATARGYGHFTTSSATARTHHLGAHHGGAN
jgi:hypothetical protein